MGQDMSIGEVARRFGVSASALRYYEQRNLLHPSRRRGGNRYFDDAQLRRVAFLRMAHELGISLEVAGRILDGPRSTWDGAARAECRRLQGVIDTAEGARTLLAAALDCRHDTPAATCPTFVAALDSVAGGVSVGDLRR